LAMDGESPSAREARLTAVRALGMSGDPKAIPVLLPLLSEKDVSIRDRAHEALQAITKRKDVPKDAKAWEAAIGGTDKVNLHG